ncbi:hypothetical protein SNE40_019251 [Patella caerulea]|uniref:Uncharacterized protein n=1 Tax=Patella caerulea TaxID=87958 RepID=A0AAN8J6Q7_PATCE
MNVLLPNLTINDTSIRVDRQQCVLKPSKAAYEIKIRGSKHKISAPSTTSEKLLWAEDSSLDEARRLAKSLAPKSVNPITEKEYLGQLILTFGKYVNLSFKWLLENDVGYVKYLLDHHYREKKKLGSIRDAWLSNISHLFFLIWKKILITVRMDKEIVLARV